MLLSFFDQTEQLHANSMTRLYAKTGLQTGIYSALHVQTLGSSIIHSFIQTHVE